MIFLHTPGFTTEGARERAGGSLTWPLLLSLLVTCEFSGGSSLGPVTLHYSHMLVMTFTVDASCVFVSTCSRTYHVASFFGPSWQSLGAVSFKVAPERGSAARRVIQGSGARLPGFLLRLDI